MEEWKDIKGYEGLYQVSNLGNVRSVDRYIEYCGIKHFYKGIILVPINVGNGYFRVSLNKNGKVEKPSIHKLVWCAFNGEIPNGMEINHLDEDTSNNSLSNLSVVSHKENINWGTRNKRVSEKMTNGKLSKAVLQFDLNGNFIKEYPSTMEVQRQFGFDSSNVGACCNHKKHFNTAYGYIWKYKSEA